jgi:hypothetical protein
VFSATPVPSNERAVNETIDRRWHIGCDAVTPTRPGSCLRARLHRGGKLITNLVKPRYVMPVKGDFKRLHLHAQLGEAVSMFIDADTSERPKRQSKTEHNFLGTNQEARRAFQRPRPRPQFIAAGASCRGSSRSARQRLRQLVHIGFDDPRQRHGDFAVAIEQLLR